MRRAAKIDNSQPEIVEAGRAEGWEWHRVQGDFEGVWWHPVLDVMFWCELKTRTSSGRIPVDQRQERQRKFLRWTGCPIFTSPDELIEHMRTYYPAGTVPAELMAFARRLKERFEQEWRASPTKASGARELIEMGQTQLSESQ